MTKAYHVYSQQASVVEARIKTQHNVVKSLIQEKRNGAPKLRPRAGTYPSTVARPHAGTWLARVTHHCPPAAGPNQCSIAESVCGGPVGIDCGVNHGAGGALGLSSADTDRVERCESTSTHSSRRQRLRPPPDAAYGCLARGPLHDIPAQAL